MGLSTAGAGTHRVGPVDTASWGCTLVTGEEVAEGETGGIHSLHSKLDSYLFKQFPINGYLESFNSFAITSNIEINNILSHLLS